MTDVWAQVGNPSSVHRAGRAARARLDRARADLAAAVNAVPDAVIFTSGGTEANALALHGHAGSCLVSAIEHDCVRASAPQAPRIPVDGDGVIDLDALERLLAAHRPSLVALMLANNETGAIQPVAEAARLAHAHGARLHCDAVQAPGRLPIDLEALGADSLSLSAHKCGGPCGSGALILRAGVRVTPVLRGGAQEGQRRAGTENLAGCVGMAHAVRLAECERTTGRCVRMAGLRDALEQRCLAAVPRAVVIGAGAPRLANTSCLAMPGVANATQLIALDMAGICVSSGAACSSGKVGPSHVLSAMGVPDELAASALRISLGPDSGDDDIAALVEAWCTLAARKGLTAAGFEPFQESA